MLKLVADSGSTKTAWCLIRENGDTEYYSTIGLNPYFVDSERVFDEIRNTLSPQLPISTDTDALTIYFYGAGCSSNENNAIITKGLRKAFPEAKISVDHDLLAAARALCGTEAGIAGILGTGSNSCYYDGTDVIDNVPALSFILGDEGSGAHMGKQLVKDYLYKEMPPHLSEIFVEKYKLSKEDIFDAVYKKALPNKFLASFSKFLSENIEEEYSKNLVRKSFSEFIDHHVTKYDNYENLPMNIVGSIAMAFENLLREVAESKGITIGKIIKFPIEDLVGFHKVNELEIQS